MSKGNGKTSRDLYGVLASLGYNGQIPKDSIGRYRPVYEVRKRKEANGIKPHKEVDLTSEAAKKAISENYTVTYYSEKGFGSVVEYKKDQKTDLFQIGRSTELLIDYIVVDTIPGPKDDIDQHLTQSTISRFACRIAVERSTHQAKIFAAGFDNNRRIFLGESAPQWANGKKYSDGLTTNGILVNHPKGQWGSEMSPGVWREVSVSGEMFGLRFSRSARHRGKTTDCSNYLRDGSMIDLCGVVLIWRTPEGLANAPKVEDLEAKRDLLNTLKAQCPVGLVTLKFSNSKNPNQTSPYVYTNCGHVHGYHVWGARPSIAYTKEKKFNDKRMCPFCKESGLFVALKFGMEPAFYIDNGPATHCFVPCGHMTTEATVKYWASALLPHGKDQFRTACPFCAVPLEGQGYIKLVFQTEADEPAEEILI